MRRYHCDISDIDVLIAVCICIFLLFGVQCLYAFYVRCDHGDIGDIDVAVKVGIALDDLFVVGL